MATGFPQLPDIDDVFKHEFLGMCLRLGCRPADLLGVGLAESGMRAAAHNRDGHASGLWQIMPDTAAGLGWDAEDCEGEGDQPPLHTFRQLSAVRQLGLFERYFVQYRGRLVSAAACYVATFLPADLALAGDTAAVLVDKSQADPKRWRRGWAYASNASFDANRDLKIQVHELEDAIRRNAVGPRADAFLLFLGLPPTPHAPVVYDLTTVWGQEVALQKLGYYKGNIDGIPGPLLKAAVLAFQKDEGLDQAGCFGPRTRATAQEALASLIRPGAVS